MERAEDEEDCTPNQPIHGSQRSKMLLGPGGMLVFSRRKMVRVWEQSTVAQPYLRSPYGNEASAGPKKVRSPTYLVLPSILLCHLTLCGGAKLFHSK